MIASHVSTRKLLPKSMRVFYLDFKMAIILKKSIQLTITQERDQDLSDTTTLTFKTYHIIYFFNNASFKIHLRVIEHVKLA